MALSTADQRWVSGLLTGVIVAVGFTSGGVVVRREQERRAIALSVAGTPSSQSSPAVPASPAIPSVAPSLPTQAPVEHAPDVHSVLLRAADIPDGFVALDEPSLIDLTEETVIEGSGCPDLDVLEARGTEVEGYVSFARGGFGHMVDETVVYQPDRAGDSFDAARRALTTCKTLEEVDEEGTPLVMTVAPLKFPAVGDEMFALRATAVVRTVRMYLDFVVVRVDDVLLVFSQTGLPDVDPALFQQVVRAGIARLKTNAGGTPV